ncbi:hypothetical protein EON82_22425 [bacterium]|nr:MAG: hypothetical protein EON82_22425 [bacterium]
MRATRPLPPGVTVHAIETAVTMGEDRLIMGHLIVELPDGSMHRITGAEMSAWNDALSHFVQKWRLDEGEPWFASDVW